MPGLQPPDFSDNPGVDSEASSKTNTRTSRATSPQLVLASAAPGAAELTDDTASCAAAAATATLPATHSCSSSAGGGGDKACANSASITSTSNPAAAVHAPLVDEELLLADKIKQVLSLLALLVQKHKY